MTNPEFSNEFDILYDSIASKDAPGLDEYEKSVFLTRAQYDIQKYYFDPSQNKSQAGYDGSKKRQVDFSTLIKSVKLNSVDIRESFDDRSVKFICPKDMFIPINEACKDKSRVYTISPLSYAEYDILMRKPYPYPPKREVWRLFTNVPKFTIGETKISDDKSIKIKNSTDKKVVFKVIGRVGVNQAPIIDEGDTEVIITCTVGVVGDTYIDNYFAAYLKDNASNIEQWVGDWKEFPFPQFKVTESTNIIVTAPAIGVVSELIGAFDKDTLEYNIRYLRRAKPIILIDLPDDLSIDGYTKESQCELDPETHPEILQRAIELAKATYSGDLGTQISLGQMSQTNIGAVAKSS